MTWRWWQRREAHPPHEVTPLSCKELASLAYLLLAGEEFDLEIVHDLIHARGIEDCAPALRHIVHLAETGNEITH